MEGNDPGEIGYWNEESGWTNRAGASLYTDAERDEFNLPMEGAWDTADVSGSKGN